MGLQKKKYQFSWTWPLLFFRSAWTRDTELFPPCRHKSKASQVKMCVFLLSCRIRFASSFEMCTFCLRSILSSAWLPLITGNFSTCIGPLPPQENWQKSCLKQNRKIRERCYKDACKCTVFAKIRWHRAWTEMEHMTTQRNNPCLPQLKKTTRHKKLTVYFL